MAESPITTREKDFAAWYQDVTILGDMAEPAEIVKGCMVIKPNGYAVWERLQRELEVLEKTGFVSYILIVWDFIHFAKGRGIPVGPGRGSAAGSMVAYVVGITDIDPLQYGLIFERFLNPDRISPPALKGKDE